MPEQQPQSQAQQQDNSQPPQGTQTSSTPHNIELYRIRAVWLIDLPPLPDELVIQEKTVALVHNEFFWSNVETIPVKDINQVNYSHIPFLATLVITGNGGQTLKISGVPQQQAMRAKNIIEGLQLEKAGEVQAAPASQPDKRRAQLAREGKTRLSAHLLTAANPLDWKVSSARIEWIRTSDLGPPMDGRIRPWHTKT